MYVGKLSTYIRCMSSFSVIKMHSQEKINNSRWKCGAQICHALFFISRVALQTITDVASTNYRHDKESQDECLCMHIGTHAHTQTLPI